MLKQSDAFNAVFNSDSRTLLIKATVDGKDYTADDLTSVEYDSATMTGESMGIGSTYENSVKITFANLVEGIKAKDEVTVSIGAELANGAYEYAPLGVFYVDDEITMDRNNNVTEITATDAMCMLEGMYIPKVTAPTTLSAMALDIANQTGVSINQDNFSKLPTIGFSTLPTNQTYRTVLGWLAMMIPGYATFDRQGQLCLRGITGSNYTISPDNYEFQGLTKNENPYTVTGITITQDNSTDYSATEQDDSDNDDSSDTNDGDTSSIDETSSADNDTNSDTTDGTEDSDSTSTDDNSDAGTTDTGDESTEVTLQAGATTGSVIAVQNNLMTQDILNAVWEVIKPIQYYPYTLNWFGNPAVEAGDWLEISDTQGNKFTVPNNSYVLTFDGGLSAVSSTGETVVSGTNWDYHGTLTQTIKQINQQVNSSGTYTYYTESDPLDPHEGDLWYKPNGDKTELYIFSNGQWISMVNDLTGKQVADEVDQAQQDIKNARAVADAANTLAKSNNQDLQLKLGTDEFNTTVSQLNSDINLRVKSGDVLSQINAEAKQILIQSGKILLDAPTVTFSGNAFIPSAAIKDLSADKLTSGTIDANKINVINFNGKNITAGTVTSDKLATDAIQVGINSMGNTIHIDKDSLNFLNDGNKLLSLDNQGLNVYSKGTLVGQILGHNWDGPTGGDPNTFSVFDSESTNDIGLSFRLQSVKGSFMSWERYDTDAKKYVPKFYWLPDPFEGIDSQTVKAIGFEPGQPTFFMEDYLFAIGGFNGGGFTSIKNPKTHVQLDQDGPGMLLLAEDSAPITVQSDDRITLSGNDIRFYSRPSNSDYAYTGKDSDGISIFDLANRVKALEGN
ncbi:hypothetical protein predicted by Glimmer/Critica [Secundilactobacillus pentosiphilus]|uniref:Uncharacterized protein n=1 Tax=Secundilactobacillus pentosiphilus TaxID=1714682 RepID=A0A1Z5IT97_9LACO|nr:hypothetical protein [Secundilactobacillus pentosiphilus]GAX04651.1 hypothetical protein predicted by Glimmer/Critica [Secundilactobacillus pentosiphilus]